MPDALHFLLLTFAGWVNRHQEAVIDYLREKNRILREQLGERGRRGRPCTASEIVALVVRMAVENPRWGYTQIRGARRTPRLAQSDGPVQRRARVGSLLNFSIERPRDEVGRLLAHHGQEELIRVLVVPATVLCPAVGEDSEELRALLVEEPEHAVIEQIRGRDGRLRRGPFRVRVDEGLPIDAAHRP